MIPSSMFHGHHQQDLLDDQEDMPVDKEDGNEEESEVLTKLLPSQGERDLMVEEESNILDRSGTDQVYSAVCSHAACSQQSRQWGDAGTHIHQ